MGVIASQITSLPSLIKYNGYIVLPSHKVLQSDRNKILYVTRQLCCCVLSKLLEWCILLPQNGFTMKFDSWWRNYKSLWWRQNGRDSVSNHQPHDCLLNRLFRRRSKKTSKLRVTGLCVGNSPGTGEFPTQMASNAENVSIWWRHHANRD